MNSLSNSRKRRWLLLCVVILGIGWGIDGLMTTLRFGLPESLGALSLVGLLAPCLWFHREPWPFRMAITLCIVEVFLSVVSFFECVISFMDHPAYLLRFFGFTFVTMASIEAQLCYFTMRALIFTGCAVVLVASREKCGQEKSGL